jgi:hypothetical protein
MKEEVRPSEWQMRVVITVIILPSTLPMGPALKISFSSPRA